MNFKYSCWKYFKISYHCGDEKEFKEFPGGLEAKDPSCICASAHLQFIPQPTVILIPHPLGKARDGTGILLDTNWIRFRCSATQTPQPAFLFFGFPFLPKKPRDK